MRLTAQVLNFEPGTWNLKLKTREVAVKTAWMWNCCLLAAVAMTGCAKFDLRKNIPWGEGKDGRIEQPMRVEAVWVDTVLSKGEQKPTRGFGGRLYFFGANNSQESVKVEGTLVIYGFDETHRDPANVVPDRKIVYPTSELKTLYSKSKLGHSYSVWVPWDEAGGMQTEISLIARFIPKKGGVITSEQIKVLLPGPKPLIDVQNVHSSQSTAPPQFSAHTPAGNIPNGVQQASFEQPVASGNEPAATQRSATKHEIESYTIPLRGEQARYFIQRPTYSGGAMVGTVGESDPAKSPPAHPIARPGATFGAQALPSPQTGVEEIPSQMPQSMIRTTLPVRRSTRFEHVKHPVQAALDARQSFGRAPWGQRPVEPQSGLASSPLPETTPPRPGSAPGAGLTSRPAPVGSAPAHQNLR